jgi:hypothetical protein
VKTSTVFRLPYLAARAPLIVLDSHLVERVRGEGLVVRFERMLETIDAVTDRAFRTDRVQGGHLRKLTAIIDETAATGPVNPRRPDETVSTAQTAEQRASPPAAGAEVAAQHSFSAAATGKKYAHVRAAATNQTAEGHSRR